MPPPRALARALVALALLPPRARGTLDAALLGRVVDATLSLCGADASVVYNVSAAGTLVVSTAAAPPGTVCALTFAPPPGASLAVAFPALLLAPQNYVTVFDAAGATLVLAAAGAGAPPPVVATAGAAVTIAYTVTTVADPHDDAGDGATALVSAVRGRAALPACEFAPACGPCVALPGCAWCVNETAAAAGGAAPGAAGGCHWTGLEGALAADASLSWLALAAPSGLCAANSSVVRSAACADVVNATAAARTAALNATPAAAALAALAGLNVAGAPARFYIFAVLLGVYALLTVLATALLFAHARHARRVNKPAAALVGNMLRAAVVAKLLELAALAALEIFAVGPATGAPPPLPVPLAAVAPLRTLAVAAGALFVALVPGVLYSAHVLPLEGKHAACAFALLAAPLALLGAGAAAAHALWHFSVVAIYNFGAGSPAATAAAVAAVGAAGGAGGLALAPPLLAHVCFVPGAAVDASGGAAPALVPQFLPVFYLAGAGLQVLAAAAALVALAGNLAALDAAAAARLPVAAQRARGAGAALLYLGAPLEALAAFAGLCIPLPAGTPAGVRALLSFFVLTAVPAAVGAAGAVVVLAADWAILNAESGKVRPEEAAGKDAPSPGARDAHPLRENKGGGG